MINNREKYSQQRRLAKKRGIEFNMTFDEWIDWWGDDIDKRGHTKNSLVMARYNDEGPYKLGNIKKITASENSSEAHKGKKRKPVSNETREKLSKAHKGKKRKSMSKETKEKISKANKEKFRVMITTPLGIFHGIKAAADAHGCDVSTIRRRIRNKEGYYNE